MSAFTENEGRAMWQSVPGSARCKQAFDDHGNIVPVTDARDEGHDSRPVAPRETRLIDAIARASGWLLRSRTRRALELRRAALAYLECPADSQARVARRLGITDRRFRQLIREARNFLIP